MAREVAIQKRIADLLRDTGAWWFKVHGNPYQRPGVPDLIACYSGIFLGIEVKTPERYRAKDQGCSPAQLMELSKIADAGGRALVVSSPDDVRKVLDEHEEA